jgi:EAL domain-containing protein (putative c-di-GMP-specific phosphodiesterase class I)
MNSGETETSGLQHVERAPATAGPLPGLHDALRENRVEFWYQPKIDLQQKRLIGVESFARFRGPDGQILPAADMMQGAATRDVVALTERALIGALQTGVNLCEIGVDVRIAINVNVAALNRLPIVEIVQKHRPRGGKCMGLVFDVSEEQVLDSVGEMKKISGQLRRCGFSIAVDDFGASIKSTLIDREAWSERIDRTFDAISQLKDVQFSEMKLDRSLVKNCDGDQLRRDICKHIIDLAHNFGSAAVGVGIERPGEMKTLQTLRCDVGQGYLFGKPMSEDELLVMLWERGIRTQPKVEPVKASR